MGEILLPPEDEDTHILLCWRDGARACDASCASFDERAMRNDSRYSPCLLLNIQRQQANALAKLAIEVQRRNNIKEEESKQRKIETSEVMKQFSDFKKKVDLVNNLPPPPEIKV
ncbi:MAG: hypothetical protein ACFFFC_00565 [Candidatus Thorarchaeota archaeon]